MTQVSGCIVFGDVMVMYRASEFCLDFLRLISALSATGKLKEFTMKFGEVGSEEEGEGLEGESLEGENVVGLPF